MNQQAAQRLFVRKKKTIRIHTRGTDSPFETPTLRCSPAVWIFLFDNFLKIRYMTKQEVKQTVEIFRPHPSNLCAGNNPRTVNIKLTGACNGACPFCIDRGGLQVAGNSHTFNTVCRKTNELKALGFDNLLLLGGEPLMYRKLGGLLENVHGGAKSIVTTTNGSLLYGQVKLLKKYFTKIHVSIHICFLKMLYGTCLIFIFMTPDDFTKIMLRFISNLI
jgi:hypothetical protein